MAKERYLKVYSLSASPSQVASYDIGSGSSSDWLTGGIWSNGEFVIGLSGTEGAFVWSFDGSTFTYKSNYDVGSDDFTAITGDKNVIYIQDALVGQERCNTTWHEILHAIVYIYSLNQANGPLKEDDAEELVVNTVSNAMMGVYRDNPWVLDMLKKHLNDIDN